MVGFVLLRDLKDGRFCSFYKISMTVGFMFGYEISKTVGFQ